MSFVCSGCRRHVDDAEYLVCVNGDCSDLYCWECTSYPKEDFLKLTVDLRANWICQKCKCKMPKLNQENTPVRTASPLNNTFTLSNNVNTVRGSLFKADTVKIPEQHHLNDLAALFKDIRELKENLQQTNIQLTAVTATLVKYEHLEKCLRERDTKITELRGTINQLQESIDTQAQKEVRNEVEVIGVPETQSENLHHAVLTLANKVGVNLTDGEIDEIYRAGARKTKADNTPRPIVVRLTRHSKRKELIKAAKIRKNLSTDGITAGPATQIFINERLSQKNRQLFRETREKSRKIGYRFCWTNEGNIFVRKTERAPAIRIRGESDIKKYLESSPASLQATSKPT